VAGVRYVEKPADPRALLALIGELTTPEPQPATAADERGAAVAVVGGDAPARERRLALLRDAGHQALGFATTAELLTAGGPARAAAVLLDLGSVGRAGAAELITLTGRAGDLPVVVLHAGDDVGLAVAAMHAGAFDFLAKPVGEDVLVETVRRALREGERRGRRHEAEIEMRHRFDRLTARERDVLRLVVAGGSNKEIAQALGISPRTVENHRARIMEKTGAHSLAELVASARNAGTAE
jgi:RNA polymerase sigma factor (sigma-70 family)